jgi:hypothetical protein
MAVDMRTKEDHQTRLNNILAGTPVTGSLLVSGGPHSPYPAL